MSPVELLLLALALVAVSCPVASPMGVPESFQTPLSPPRTSNLVEETPYVAYLTIDRMNCTGALLGTGWLITSAFCYSDKWLGRSYAMLGGARYVDAADLWRAPVQYDPLVELRTHPDYRQGGFQHNVMLARVATKFGVSVWVRPIDVTPLTRWPKGWRASCLVSGMGQTRPEEATGRLTTVRVDVRSVDACEPWVDESVRQYTLCTRDSASVFCYGDQGGPVVHDGVLLAVQTSAAFRRPSRTDCGDRVLYQIYTFVGYYRPWIYSIVPQQGWSAVRESSSNTLAPSVLPLLVAATAPPLLLLLREAL